ncbi:MAG: HNH/ENDO VII family nuclease [Lachnospiraceae bacterium]|nr:HNH/ENDO VII family nuclease [Lachnospiraceae bacterium]
MLRLRKQRVISLLLTCTLLLSSCGVLQRDTRGINAETLTEEGVKGINAEVLMEEGAKGINEEVLTVETANSENEISSGMDGETAEVGIDLEPVDSKVPAPEPKFSSLDDPALLGFVENTVFRDVSEKLGDGYRIDNVSAMYISKEYLEELAYNSKANIFFGYSLAALDQQFKGTRYVFALDDNGETVVVPFEAYDDTYEKVIKNVAIGTGVILVCVTVSAVSGGLGAPAVSMIFAASAKSGALFAASGGAMSAVISGVATGVQTKDFDKALKAGALAGSESFKWGAISGSLLGGGSELVMLKTAAGGGLSLDEAAIIIRDTRLPANFVRQIHSMDEYHELLDIASRTGFTIQEMSKVCMMTGYPLKLVKLFKNTKEGMIYFKQAGLYSETINGQAALIRSIDLTYESDLAGKTVTNLDRMRKGLPAIDPASGQPFQLHHIGQSVDSPLAILSRFEHTGGGNTAILHNTQIADGSGVHNLISDASWSAQKKEFWEALATFLTK